MEKRSKKTPRPTWTGPRLPPDLERMDVAARRRYLERHLLEIELLIDAVMMRYEAKSPKFTIWDIASPESPLWEEAMNLNYLEASRLAILETLAELNRPA